MSHIWLRNEDDTHERRAPLTPGDATKLVKMGYEVTIENSNLRAFTIDAYKQAGCDVVDPHSWQQAPLDAYILGLKELNDSLAPLPHQHIYFSHSYKGQFD